MDSIKFNMKRINLILSIIVFVFMFSFTSAYTMGETLTITQGCVNSTYSNISSIFIEEPSQKFILNSETQMVNLGNGNYQYNLTDTYTQGVYRVIGHCDIDGIDQQFAPYYQITSSGSSSNSSVAIFMFLIVLVYLIGFIGFFGRNEWISMLGGGLMILLGIFIIQIGMVIYRNDLTNYLSYITIGLGFIFFLLPAIEKIEENL